MKHVLTALVAVFSLSLVGELGSTWWVFDLFSHWRMHYFLGGLVLVALTWYYKRPKLSVVSGVIGLVHLMIASPYLNFFATSAQVQAADTSQLVTTAYINSYWKQENMNQVVQAIKDINADVVFLEEIQPEQYETVKRELADYPHSYHQSVTYAFDMAVFSKLPIAEVTPHFFVENVPTLEATIPIGEKTVQFFGVHPYSPVNHEYTQLRNELLMELFAYVNKQDDTTIMGGDFNVTPFSPVYREMTEGTRLVDTQQEFRIANTWPSHVPNALAIPIDLVFVSRDVHVVERYRGPQSGSDHWPIVVKVRL